MRHISKAAFGLIATLAVLTIARPASAHHAFASEFDINKPIELKGTLTKLEWINPHGWVYIDVKNPKTGKMDNWAIEFGGPTALLRRGLRKTDFPIGAQVTMKGYLAKNGKKFANALSVTLPDGRAFFAGSSAPGAPQ